MGGDRRFVAKLDTLFDSKVDPASFANVEDISGLIGFYAHGNEPSHHIGYLYVTRVRRGGRSSGSRRLCPVNINRRRTDLQATTTWGRCPPGCCSPRSAFIR
jgi:hypothetical protein